MKSHKLIMVGWGSGFFDIDSDEAYREMLPFLELWLAFLGQMPPTHGVTVRLGMQSEEGNWNDVRATGRITIQGCQSTYPLYIPLGQVNPKGLLMFIPLSIHPRKNGLESEAKEPV